MSTETDAQGLAPGANVRTHVMVAEPGDANEEAI